MTDLEKDLLILGAIGCLLKEENKNLKDIIPEYDGKKFNEFAMTTNLFQSEGSTNRGIFDLVRECYDRIKEHLE